LSPDILNELQDVLTRPEIQTKFPSLTAERVDTFLNDVLSMSNMLQNPPSVFALPRDHKDEPYINLAIEVGASYLVTWNERHLTYLMRQDTPEGRDFCQRFPGIKIVDPPTFVGEIQQRPGRI
jgi:putative PIN family toxin of toxin-antitoxin system